MASGGGSWQRRLSAIESAGRLLTELGVDQNEQIDVFKICEDLGLWLAFLPMDNLLGAFIPEGAGGVLITTQRPIPIQRYTAAHEIGHWRLDHGNALDSEEFVLGATHVEREQLAQIFAASLLMPPPLVLGILERLGVQGTNLGPRHAYELAREAGVSYEAAVRQLTHLELITPETASALRQARPIAVKAEIAFGRRPVSGHADVWPVDEAWDDHVLSIRVEDEVLISLPENRSTGYRWMFPGETFQVEQGKIEVPSSALPTLNPLAIETFCRTVGSNSVAVAPTGAVSRVAKAGGYPIPPSEPIAGLDVVGDIYQSSRAAWVAPRDSRRNRTKQLAELRSTGRADNVQLSPLERIGGTGRRVLGVRFTLPGSTTVRLEYRSPYSPNEQLLDEYVLHALVEPRRAGFSIDQLADDSDEDWKANVRQRRIENHLEPLPIDESDSIADEDSNDGEDHAV
jgi:Zn-dependent peptidase ImmA (M78 family)